MKVPGYSIERLIGKGGMSSVYLAVQKSLNRRVALKVMKKYDDPKQAERFVHEGRIIAALSHRNIITIYDVGTVHDRHFIAMEYLQGHSLAERIDKGLPLDKALSLLEQMAACLHFVHRRGIIHRDIKPSNILFHADGTPKLTDFGIAKLVHTDQELTLARSALGSPYYLSPEQAAGLPLDGRSDIYSLGIVFYQMLTGERPYAKATPAETIAAHLTQPLPVLPDALRDYQDLLESMIAKLPEERVASAKLLAYRIRGMKEHAPTNRASPVAASVDATQPRARMALGTVAIFAVALLAVAVTAWRPVDNTAETASVTQLQPEASVNVAPGEAVKRDEPTLAAPKPEVLLPPVSTNVLAARDNPAVPLAVTSLPTKDGEQTGQTDDSSTVSRRDTNDADLVSVTDPPPIVVDGASPPAVTVEPDETGAGQPAPVVDEGDDQRIATLMRAAEQAMADLRLTRPQKHSAIAYYSQVLALDPAHAGAQAGVKAIAASYRAMAEKALGRNRDGRARRYVRRGLRVRPNDQGLKALLAQLDERQRDHAVAMNEPPMMPVVEGSSNESQGIRGREGSGNIVKDFGRVWRAVFD